MKQAVWIALAMVVGMICFIVATQPDPHPPVVHRVIDLWEGE